jgi:rhomboid protease GluP
MFRKTSGSSLCPNCGKLNSVNAPVCFYCGWRNPGLWGFGPVVVRFLREMDFARIVTVLSVGAYVLSLLLDVRSVLHPRGPFGILAPSSASLDALGITGAYAWARGRWWTFITAIYLHGNLLHLVFNMLWINQLASVVEELYGRSRFILIFTWAGALGFIVSSAVGVPFTLGASGSVFGLLGAMVAYARSRGGLFGMSILRQYGMWALILFILGFLMPGVNNFAHAGGFAVGFLLGVLLGHSDAYRERSIHYLATATVILTAFSFALALWNGFVS